MVRYEVLFLTVPEVTLDETNNLETQLRNVVREHHGESISFERWGKYRLAYAIQKNEYGVYFLFRFTLVPANLQQFMQSLRSMLHLKFGEVVMRYVAHRIAHDSTLAYQRPESLEDVPGRTADALLREHKVSMHDEHESDDMSEALTTAEA